MSSEVSRSRTVDLAADKYDHEISLIDSTASKTEGQPKLETSGSWRHLARNPTRTSVQEALSRRKYAKWRQDKYDAGEDASATEEPSEVTEVQPSGFVPEPHPQNAESEAVDFAPQPEVVGKQKAEEPKQKQNKPESEVDILYENQRGSFFCGIPLYSHSSLLNFDPAAWVTKDFKNSPVNITNAQVPDPSWVWSWKTWYVDMSYDVDEEGWQYSFSFGNNFSWHGTHPWFHSFVRRRRWLRKRVKRTGGLPKDKEGTLEAAHHLNTDYFTIHSNAQERNPASPSNPDAVLTRPLSFKSVTSVEEEDTKEPHEIRDVPSLMKAIKKATIDREKVDAVKFFINNGGDELFYLEEKMSDIMSTLVFQNSKRQILQHLKKAADDAQQHRDEHDAEDRPEGPDEKRRIDNLLKAAKAADKEIYGLEYWSDRKHVLRTTDEKALDDKVDSAGDPRPADHNVIGEIRGISEKAEVSAEVRVDRRLIDKGKKPERQAESPSEEGNESQEKGKPGLPQDSVLVSDKDDDANGKS
ncbi:hypothetical protein H2198_006624 [Neophaeococcomyces mojaviensis]|uniref:Uncharacterized protein n=1 Tax=Neophaeococcomyces mojaviensis TaxID=3383035 RepID=A0ACC3A2H8_9EURO|nr:hypothetical protein H2198_006624 [Knufia sp. JES_112]